MTASHSPEPTSASRIAARRDYNGPVFLSQGFRPFFLGAGLWAALAVALWLGEWLGLLPPLMVLSAGWHAHEMIFGFAGASIGGFILTAIPNWTGRLPVRGAGLGGLVLLWLGGRVAMVSTDILGSIGAGIIDSAYLIILSLVIWREIIAGRNWRNAKVAATISLLAAANILFHWLSAQNYGDTALAERLGVAVLIVLIALIGGRVIPSFTRNTLARRGDPKLPSPVSNTDRFTLIVTTITGISWVLYPESLLCGGLALISSALHLERLTRWRGLAVLGEPMLWVLHLGYLWISIGFGLLAAHVFLNLVPQSSAIHAFTAGAFGTMILAIMTRASRGHSGLPLTADRTTTSIYGFVTLAAIFRVTGSLTNMPLYYGFSGMFWILAFAVFVIAYWKVLTTDLRAQKR